jgi:transporter family-2 protein
MYYFFSLLTGIIFSIRVVFNGGLSRQYGVYSAAIIVHIVGLIFISLILLAKRQNPFIKRYNWYLYLGGVIGAFSTIFTNLAFGRISVSAILALGLLGQSITGIIVDHFGLLSMRKHPFRKQKIIGLVLIFCGIVSMITEFEVLAVALSFFAGVIIVIIRAMNARLAGYSGSYICTFFYYIFGLIMVIMVFLFLGKDEPMYMNFFTLSPKFYIYFGGVLGVCIIMVNNITAPKISAFYLSLFSFSGQIFSGIVIDSLISQEFLLKNLISGIFISAGLSINLLLDKREIKNERTN